MTGIAAVTGAASPVGLAICLSLAQKGYRLFLHGKKAMSKLEGLRQKIELFGGAVCGVVCADLSTEAGQNDFCRQVKQQAGVLDVLIHNAAVFEEVSFSAVTRFQYNELLSVNLTAPFFITQELLPLLLKSQNPNIIHLLDARCQRPWPRHAPYALSKAALLALNQTLAYELSPRVRVNAVAPGVLQSTLYSEERKSKILAKIPLKRLGAPEEVAQAVLYLVLQASFTTGQVLYVDGGQNASCLKSG